MDNSRGDISEPASEKVPHIDAYEFGRITIDGQIYRADVIITPRGVRANWWRQRGHSLCPEDLTVLDEVSPEVLIIGCGASGALTVPSATRQWIADRGMRLITLPTREACARYNALAAEAPVVAGLHLTC